MKNLVVVLSAVILISFLNVNRAFSDTTFVSGQIIGQNWNVSGSPYVVTGNIQIAGLSIDPGVYILFAGNFEIEVQGVIEAIGTEQSPILFSPKAGVSSWKGIRFQNSYPGSFLKHCIIEKANNSGVRIINSLPVITCCTIRSNQATAPSYGGGVYISIASSDSIKLVECLFEQNLADETSQNDSRGGALYVNSGNVEIKRCQFLNNRSYSTRNENYVSTYSYGGAVFINSANVSIYNCRFIQNMVQTNVGGGGTSSHAHGGGIYMGAGNLSIINSILSKNTSSCSGSNNNSFYPNGAGIMAAGGQTKIINSTITSSNVEGLNRSAGTVTVTNSIIYFNNGNSTQAVGTHTITYSDVQGGYSGVGNIDYNPSLDSNQKIALTSLCRNAGNDSIVYNDACFPPSYSGVRNDMGAHGGPGACEWNDMKIKVKITALMEGMFNPVSNLMSNQQVQRLILRSAAPPYKIIEAAVANITTSGISGEFLFNASPTGIYYLVAKNFNCIETWSKSGGESLVRNNSVYNYNFTSSISQAYGNNLILSGTKYCFFSGDVNQDGFVDASDLAGVENDATVGADGYVQTDLNGDFFVDSSDLSIVENNSFGSVSMQRP